jgi:hypothetical protein
MSDVSYPVVRRYVAERRPQIRVEAGRASAEVFIDAPARRGDVMRTSASLPGAARRVGLPAAQARSPRLRDAACVRRVGPSADRGAARHVPEPA